MEIKSIFMYSEKKHKFLCYSYNFFAVLSYAQTIQIPTGLRSRAEGLILYCIAI